VGGAFSVHISTAVLEVLGEGGMATVFKAYDTRLERLVAVKVIRSEDDPSGDFLKRFEREARALAHLSHPHIVKILDYGDHQGRPFLVMEYLPGGTLSRMMGYPVPYQDAARWLAPVARALDFAHQHKIIHRDVKPGNFLISESGDILLSDFGIAKTGVSPAKP
jgi:eukaryotic-like serine/threonine-protein kinase